LDHNEGTIKTISVPGPKPGGGLVAPAVVLGGVRDADLRVFGADVQKEAGLGNLKIKDQK